MDDDFVLATAHANRFSRGYFDQSAQVWTRAGGLLASTHQIVYFKGLQVYTSPVKRHA